MFSINRNVSAFYVMLILYKLLLGFIYINFMSVVVAYYGFHYKPNFMLTIISWFIYLLCMVFIKSNFEKSSDFFVFIFFILIISPMLILMELGGKDPTYFFYSLVCFVVINLMVRMPDIKLPRFKNGNYLVLTLSLAIVFATFSMFYITGGFGKITFDLTRVYEVRLETSVIYFGGIWGYVTTWATKIVLPFLLSIALFREKYLFLAFMIFVQALAFGITGHRSMAILWLIAIAIFLARNKKHRNFYVLVSFMCFLSVIYLLYAYFDEIMVSSTIFRRALFLPSFLNYTYYEFFSVNEYVYYSNTVLSGIIEYPYGDVKLSHVVAGEILGTPEAGANTGFLGSSFAHGGPVGMLVISIFVGMILKLFDSACKSKNETCFYLSFVSIPVLAMLTSAAFFTSLLTHGILLLLFITCLYEFNGPQKTIVKGYVSRRTEIQP
jgi:hypothetical protein